MLETQVQFLSQEDSPGEGNGYSLQYSWPENSLDRGAWWATVHGVEKRGLTNTFFPWDKFLLHQTLLWGTVCRYIMSSNRNFRITVLDPDKPQYCDFQNFKNLPVSMWVVTCLWTLTTTPSPKPKELPVSQDHNPLRPLLFFVHNSRFQCFKDKNVNKQENTTVTHNQEKNQLTKIDGSHNRITK